MGWGSGIRDAEKANSGSQIYGSKRHPSVYAYLQLSGAPLGLVHDINDMYEEKIQFVG
jgi:hypothetical protein